MLQLQEDGGATYHQRFRTHEFVRGQEGDWWKGDVEKLRDVNYPKREVFPPIKTAGAAKRRQDAINREQSPTTETMPQYKCEPTVTRGHLFACPPVHIPASPPDLLPHLHFMHGLGFVGYHFEEHFLLVLISLRPIWMPTNGSLCSLCNSLS